MNYAKVLIMNKKTNGIMVLEMKERLPDLLDIANQVHMMEGILLEEGRKNASCWMHACHKSLLEAVDNFEGALAYLDYAETRLGEEI
jgi:hypothetical protein